MLIDSHCHLDQLDFQHKNLDDYLKAASLADVRFFLCPGIKLENVPAILDIAHKHPNIVVTVGKHPTELGIDPTVDELVKLGNDNKVVGIGETGLDYYYCKTEAEKEQQRQLFRIHVKAAKLLNKPLVIHSREAATDILQILQEENAAAIGGVLHCFTESLQDAAAALAMNFYISFSGIVTFKNAANLREVAQKVPLARMLIETDAPYLAPVPMRGKANEPAFLHYIAEYLANLRGITYNELAEQTSRNFFELFGKHGE